MICANPDRSCSAATADLLRRRAGRTLRDAGRRRGGDGRQAVRADLRGLPRPRRRARGPAGRPGARAGDRRRRRHRRQGANAQGHRPALRRRRHPRRGDAGQRMAGSIPPPPSVCSARPGRMRPTSPTTLPGRADATAGVTARDRRGYKRRILRDRSNMQGAFLEDLEVGQAAELKRTVAEGDLEAFAKVTGDDNPVAPRRGLRRRHALQGPHRPRHAERRLHLRRAGHEAAGPGRDLRLADAAASAARCGSATR